MISVLKKPKISEKSEKVSNKNNVYTFEVDIKASKDEIKNAIEKMYDVKVLKINTLRQGGGKPDKKHTNKGVVYKRNKLVKKAMIRLQNNDVIDFYSSI